MTSVKIRRRPGNSKASRKSTNKLPYDNLETRLMLTTFLINTTADEGSGGVNGFLSLREAITAANTNAAFGDAPAGSADGDAIRFAPSLANSTIFLGAGQLTITDDVMLQAGSSNITIDGGGISRIFQVTTDERVSFGKMNFTGGTASTGGAISSVVAGTTIVFESSFSGNEATGQGGGAIYNAVGRMFITGSTFTDNNATGESGSGGAVLSASGLTAVSGGVMSDNSANQAGGAVEVVNGEFYLTNSQIGADGAANVAGPAGSANPGNGGGINVSGSATVAVNGSDVSYNTAQHEGGGLWNQVGSRMFINNGSTVSNNTAAGVEAHDGGGGVFNNGGNVYITASTIASNQANGTAGSGGGIFSTDGVVLVFNSTIDSNVAARAGGGLEIVDGFNQLSNSMVTSNDAGVTLTAAPGNGGGLHISGLASTIVTGGIISDNRAQNQGGGIWNQSGTNMFLRNGATIRDNATASTNSRGGGIYNRGYLSAVDSFFQRNEAGVLGGGIYASDTARTIIINDSFNRNTASTRGGGFYNDGFSRVEDSTFISNVVSFEGGAVYTGPAATTLFSNNFFSGNLPNNTN